jgi:hypothetical protein
MGRVTVTHDPAQERRPRVESARVTVTRRSGPAVTAFVPAVEGYPSHPLSAHRVEAKARGLLAPALGEAATTRVIELVDGIEDLPTVAPLLEALVPVDAAVGR